MNLLKYLSPDKILVGVEAENKWTLIEHMVDHLMAHRTPFAGMPSRDEIVNEVRKREERQSTGIGDGFALPHARMDSSSRLRICLALLKTPLEFESMDGQPVQVVCLAIYNSREPTLALKVMSAWAKIIGAPGMREQLLTAHNSTEVYERLSRLDLDSGEVVLATDLMIPPTFTVLPEHPIREVTHQMMSHRESSTAVQDATGQLVGEITSDLLFQFGMPDFFKQLQSVSFVKNFNPLENYFEIESRLTAGDIMGKDYAEIGPDGTLIEVIFLLSVKKHGKVYVTHQGQLLGMIDRVSVINRAINF